MKKHSVVLWIPSDSEESKLRAELEKLGYKCLRCESLEQINALVMKHQYNIGLLVLDSSVGNIPLLCKELKQNELLNCYLMVLSNSVGGSEEHDALESGADMYLEKFRVPVLAMRIDSILRRGR